MKRSKPEKRQSIATNTTQPPPFGWLTATTGAGVQVTPQTALTFTAYYAAVRVISEDLASLPLVVFRELPNGGSEPQPDHPISERFNWSADGECSALNWREAAQAQVLGWGNSVSEIEWSKRGECLGLHSIAPNEVLPKRKDSGRLFYELQSGTNREIPAWKIFHVAGLGFNGLWGYSPVTLAREGIGLGKAGEHMGASIFGNGAIPHGVLEYPGAMKPEAIKNLRESINAVHQGPKNANKLMILEQGMKWVSTQISPEDAQFLATRQFQVVEICRIFRLPPHKIADYTHVQPTNLEVINQDYVTSCLRPWCERWENAISFKLLSQDERRAGFYVRHDMTALLRANTKDRGDWYSKMSTVGLYSRDEIAALEDMNPIGKELGGEKRFRPAYLLELDAEQVVGDPGQAPKPAGEDQKRFGAHLNGHTA